MDSNVDKVNSIADKQHLAWSQEIPNYGNKLLKRLDDFRKTTILYDVRVRADGGEFNAHKVILAACGGIFRTCFVDEEKQMISSEITELSLDCPAQGLKPIIRFAYTGALVVTKRNAVATMIAAEVTKMKEVQEISADIAVKEYGWLIHFVGEKDATTIESLGKVLQMHVPCFTASCSNGSHVTDGEEDLPFTEEVDKEFPDRATTYQRLAIKLKSAETIVTTTKFKSKQSAEQKPVSDEPAEDAAAIKAKDGPVTTDTYSLKAPEPANFKPPVPNGKSVKLDVAGDDDDDETNPFALVPEGETPRKPVTSPSMTVKGLESANPEPLQPLIWGHKKSKSDVVDDVIVAADYDDEKNPFAPLPKEKTSNKPVTSPSPKVDVTEYLNPIHLWTPQNSKPDQSDSVDPASIDWTPKRQAPPSPIVKPRNLLKSKKSVRAPPPPSTIDKFPSPATLPRQTKSPAKVPPPRPRPPVTKRNSISNEQGGSPTEKEVADDYDDSLNPFA